MKIINIEDTFIIDSDKEGVGLVFKNDEERLLVANHLLNMLPSTGKRVYCIYPDKKYDEETMRNFTKDCKRY